MPYHVYILFYYHFISRVVSMAATPCCTFAEPQEFLQQHSSTLCPAFPLRVHQQLEMLLCFFLPLPRTTRGSGKGNHWSFIARTIILYLLEKVFCLSFLLPCMIITYLQEPTSFIEQCSVGALGWCQGNIVENMASCNLVSGKRYVQQTQVFDWQEDRNHVWFPSYWYDSVPN